MSCHLVQLKQQEFDKKSQILGSFFEEISPATFYETLLVENMQNILYIIENQTYKVAPDIFSLLELSYFRMDIFIPPATFIKNCYSLKTLNHLYAFIIDIDNLNPETLLFVCQRIVQKGFKFAPTLVLNSGGGLHLYYVLKKPLECFYKRHKILKLIIRKLQTVWQSKNYTVDKNTTLIQPFRAAGSLNKSGQKTTCFLSGEKYTIDTLAKALQVQLWNGRDTHSSDKNNKKKHTILHLPNGDKPFYYHCYFRITEEVEIGHRYMSLFALAVVGYKCRISKRKVEQDIYNLVNFFNANVSKNMLLHESEISKAMKGYSNEYVIVSSNQLEEWLGFTFPRTTKRNGRKQKEHLAFARAVKRLRTGLRDKEITELFSQGVAVKEIASRIGISVKTVYRKLAKFK